MVGILFRSNHSQYGHTGYVIPAELLLDTFSSRKSTTH